jgi:hypothetical protein
MSILWSEAKNRKVEQSEPNHEKDRR